VRSQVRSRRHVPDHPDHISWAARVTLEGYGAVIGVRASDAALLPALRRLAPPGARVGAAHVADAVYSVVVRRSGARRVFSPTHRLYEDSRCLRESDDLDAILAALESAVQFTMACCARKKLFVHAGVVGWHGGVILLPGRTHSGKSSLVAALVRAGATYYSDEYAVLDDAGLVHPFARPLGIRDADGHIRSVSAQSLGAAVGDAPATVSLVVATRHVAGTRWRPEPMSPGETVLALLENTLAVQKRPADTLRILTAAVTNARALRGDRGEAAGVAEKILASCPQPSH
jgi:hypothetical protein